MKKIEREKLHDRVTSRIGRQLKDKLAEYCLRESRTEGAVIRIALQKFLNTGKNHASR